MTNYVGADVIRLIGVNHPDEIESDNHYETGTITAKLGNKVRIRWIDRYHVKDSISFEFLTNLSRLDKDTMYVKPVETDITDIVTTSDNSDDSFAPGNSGNQHASVEALESALSAGMQAESDENDNSDVPGHTDNDPKPVESAQKPRTRRSTVKAA